MNKHTVVVIALLGITGYSFAEEQERVTHDTIKVTMTSEIRVDKDLAEDVVAEAKKDASALQEKYEPVCGINAVETTITQSVQEEEITRSCNSSCKCKCKSCSSGSCCSSCKSVTAEEVCNCEIVRVTCPDCGQVNEEFRCACGKPRLQEVEVNRCPCNKPKKDVEA